MPFACNGEFVTKQFTTGSRPQSAHPQLLHEPGTFTAILVGLGSILGTGVFVGLGLGVHIAGTAVILAIGLAGLVSICNGLSVARLATHDVQNNSATGGPHEYGAKYLNPHLSFTAAWMFLCAKTTSAATAALAIAGYLLSAFNISNEFSRVGLALIAVVILAGLLLRTDSSWTRISTLTHLIVATVALSTLFLFIIGGLPHLIQNFGQTWSAIETPRTGGANPLREILHAAALACMAFVGYGRIATMSTELRRPGVAVPRAVVSSILIAMALFLAVVLVGVGVVGAPGFAQSTLDSWAPLEEIAVAYSVPGVAWVIGIGAILAMLGILFNLIQSLSRLMLIMGRRKDMPNPVARVSKITHAPETAVVVIGLLISLCVLIGDIQITWSLAAFSVLIYYAVVNLAVVYMPVSNPRRGITATRLVASFALLCCLFLAFWLEPQTWLFGVGLIGVGHAWRWLVRKL